MFISIYIYNLSKIDDEGWEDLSIYVYVKILQYEKGKIESGIGAYIIVVRAIVWTIMHLIGVDPWVPSALIKDCTRFKEVAIIEYKNVVYARGSKRGCKGKWEKDREREGTRMK